MNLDRGEKLKIGVSGASGLTGSHLCQRLQQSGHFLRAFSRHPDRQPGFEAEPVVWNAVNGPPSRKTLEDLDIFIHLVGKPLFGGRWTEKKKEAISDSRILATRHLVQGLRQSKGSLKLLISASAVGYYGDTGQKPVDEQSPPGEGFLADLCQEWEKEARPVKEMGSRLVLLRTGIVLSREGGALPMIMMPFKLFVGGPLGSGDQFISWIQLEDWVRLVCFAIEQEEVRGALNLTAPNPVTNEVFSQELGNILKRPSFLRTPGFLIKLGLGEMGEAVLEGQRVIPRKALGLGFEFQFEDVSRALSHTLLSNE